MTGWNDWESLLQNDPTVGDVLPLRRGKNGLELAVPNALRAVGRAIALPGQVLAGEVDPMSPEGKSRAVEMALTLAGSGRGLRAPEGALGVFAGRRAATADTRALGTAMSQAGRGISPENTWNRTGWYQDVDGKWKFEISDTNAKLIHSSFDPVKDKTQGQVLPKSDATLSTVLEHPALFQAYPHLRDIPVIPENDGGLGSHTPPRGGDTIGKIGLASQHPSSALSTLLHETQHAIQTYEGFATGGAPSEWLPPKFRQLVAHHEGVVRGAQDRLTKALQGGGAGFNSDANMNAVQTKLGIWSLLTGKGSGPTPGQMNAIAQAQMLHPEEYSGLQDALADMRTVYQMQDDAHSNYSRLAGEVEARNVEERRAGELSDRDPEFHDPNYPDIMPPWHTPGYTPRGDQTVRFQPRSDEAFIAGLPDWLRKEHYHLDTVEHDPFAGGQ